MLTPPTSKYSHRVAILCPSKYTKMHIIASDFSIFPGGACPRTPERGSGFTQAFAVCTQVDWCLEISLQSCWGAVAHVPEPTLRSKDGSIDRGKLSRAAFVRESNQTRSLKTLSVRDKTKRSCTTVARLPTWCPHLQRKHPSKVAGPTVVTQEPQAGRQLPRAASAGAPVSLSLPLSVLLSECCPSSRQFESRWSRYGGAYFVTASSRCMATDI